MGNDEQWPWWSGKDDASSQNELLEINTRFFKEFVVHTKTVNTMQHCTGEQLQQIKRGMEKIRTIIMQDVPEQKRRQPLEKLNDFLDTISLATVPLAFEMGNLFYPRLLYHVLFEAANESERNDAPFWILEHMQGAHIIYDERGYILHAHEPFGGFTKEDLIGKHFTQFVVPEFIPFAMQNFGNLFRGKLGSHSLLMNLKDGVSWVNLHCHPYPKGDKLMVLSALKKGRLEPYEERDEIDPGELEG